MNQQNENDLITKLVKQEIILECKFKPLHVAKEFEQRLTGELQFYLKRRSNPEQYKNPHTTGLLSLVAYGPPDDFSTDTELRILTHHAYYKIINKLDKVDKPNKT